MCGISFEPYEAAMEVTRQQFIDHLKSIVGSDHVHHSPEDLTTYAYDGTPGFNVPPLAVVQPLTTEEVAQVIRYAYSNDVPIIPRGSGTGLSGGCVPVENGLVLQMVRMDKILEIDTVNLTALAEPGVITANLAAAVEKLGLFYPPDPGSMKISTLGGNVAENAGGLRCFKYGVTRDYLMGLEVVLPDGSILKTGGKAKKDVAGYDLTRLFAGSEGTLGIVTRILVSLRPKPAATATILVFFDSLVDAGEAVTRIVANGIIPCTLEFLDNTVINCVEDNAKLGLLRDKAALLLIQVDGHPQQIRHEIEAARESCMAHGASQVSVATSDAEADQLVEARRAALSSLARVSPTTILEDATVPRSELANMIAFIQSVAQKYKLRVGVFGHVGDGNLHPTFLTDERNREEMLQVHKAAEEIFQKAIELGGTITGEHGVGIAKKRFLPAMIGEGGMEIMRRIKKVFDPKGLLNPGKMF